MSWGDGERDWTRAELKEHSGQKVTYSICKRRLPRISHHGSNLLGLEQPFSKGGNKDWLLITFSSINTAAMIDISLVSCIESVSRKSR